MEELNNIIRKLNIRKISVGDNINMEERNSILETLNRPWSQDEWNLDFASKDLKRDRDIVMAAVKQRGWALKDAS